MDSAFYKQHTLPDLITAHAQPSLPEQIGPYKIESRFNKGGMSLLYLGLHPEKRIPAIVKVLSPAYVNNSAALEQFIKEANIISLTNHPNIVKLYESGPWEGGFYIAMELIRGVSLRQFIVQHSLSLKRALEIILQVATALYHLHSHHVIHRDLKPENILITEEGNVKVIDFGIAQLHQESSPISRATQIIGTPNYMSPEQKENPAQVTYASDIYSLGIILYELVLGKLSYGLITLTGLPKTLKGILAKALAISPEQRYQNLFDFMQDLTSYLHSSAFDKEKPGTEQLKEIQEELKKSAQSLCASTPTDWPQVDIGVAKAKHPTPFGLYIDTFKLEDNSYLIALGSTLTNAVSSPVAIGFLKGLFHSAFHSQKAFSLTALATQLNHLIFTSGSEQPLALSLTLLNPLQDTISYVSCGMPSLLHLSPDGNRLNTLHANNPLLGAYQNPTFTQTGDNWNEGDLLILHSLHINEGDDADLSLQATLKQALVEHSLLSAKAQAEQLLSAAEASSAYPLITYNKAVMSIQRLI